VVLQAVTVIHFFCGCCKKARKCIRAVPEGPYMWWANTRNLGGPSEVVGPALLPVLLPAPSEPEEPDALGPDLQDVGHQQQATLGNKGTAYMH
jgi:hypothetical protein